MGMRVTTSNAVPTRMRLRAVGEVPRVYPTGSAGLQIALASWLTAEVHARTHPGGLTCVRSSASQVKLSYHPLPCMQMGN